MSFDLRIKTITFSGSPEPVNIDKCEVIIFVGANNAGKSRALREIRSLLVGVLAGAVVAGLEAHRSGTLDEIEQWFDANATEASTPDGRLRLFVATRESGPPVYVDLDSARQTWASGYSLADVAFFVTLLANAETRLDLAESVDSIDILDGEATQPLQRLLLDHAAERRLVDSVKRAFGEQVVVNRAGGARIHLHLGRINAEPRLDSESYLRELRELPLVANQGDGMRSFIGLMLAVLATPYPILLIDEPEAFLHPPQEREIGRQLGVSSGQQRFIATHSSDVLLGLLDKATSTTVIRLRRRGERNLASVLREGDIRQLRNDPTLRYSNLLDGLFHRGVVLCEADGDARLYGAALDAALEAGRHPATDLLFTHCGGKQKFPDALRALRSLDVPVAAVADLDILREERLFRAIVEVLGGEWESVRGDWTVVARAVETLPALAPVVSDIRAQIAEVLGVDDAARLAEDQVRRIRELTKSVDGWRLLKSAGVRGIPNGHATAAMHRLLPRLEELGLFVVIVGELEGWAPEIGKHGAAFVTAALDAGVHQHAPALREFAVRVAAGIARLEADVS